MKASETIKVIEKQKGNSTTDWGAPDMIARADGDEMTTKELDRHVKILQACWAAFDAAATKVKGKTLATGPRGGGRNVAKMRAHVLEADRAYLGPLGGDTKAKDARGAFVDALRKRNSGELPDKGPRGGKRWPARYAIRRSAWHALDHAWELEDRVQA